MTKSTKHKKEFRKEKNKIKLKLSTKKAKVIKSKTQFLPKGLNVTNTSFKTKKIVLSENLRPDEDSGLPLTGRKQTFKELLSHLNHVNSSIQQDGLNGMKELLGKFPETIEANLNTVLVKTSELICSQESAVRKCSLKFLEQIFQTIKAENISPFYPMLNAQLLCAMNHISLDIQRDSHLLLDIMLTNTPELVSTTATMILPNFLDQISCQDNAKSGRRILAIQPSQKLTSLKWRREVMIRIHRLLELLQENNVILKPVECKNVEVGEAACGLYSRRRYRTQLNLCQTDQTIDRSKKAGFNVRDFASNLLPLIIETWVEASSSEQLNQSEGSSLVSMETGELLKISISLIVQIWNMISKSENQAELIEWFEKNYSQQLIRHFVVPFPFYSRVERKRGARSSDGECWEQNLMICFLWSLLSTKNVSKTAKTIFLYLSGFLTKRDRPAISAAELDILKKIVMSSLRKKNIAPLLGQLFQSMIELSQRNASNNRDRIAISRLLMDVGCSLDRTTNIPALNEWIDNCPNILHDSANHSLLGTLNFVLSRNSASRQVGEKEAQSFLSRLDTIDESNHDIVKEVFNYFFWTWNGSEDCAAKLTILENVAQRLNDPSTKAYCSGVLQIVGKY